MVEITETFLRCTTPFDEQSFTVGNAECEITTQPLPLLVMHNFIAVDPR